MAKPNFHEIEERIEKFWDEEQIYKFDADSDKEIFSVDTPPPTISGKLHMGHAFGDSQQDFIVRYKRMKGFNVLNPFGTDNNGLPTLKLVEKLKKVSSKHMKREDFIELCDKTIHDEFIPEFVKDSKRLGISADRSLFYSTIDERARRISQKSFIDLFNMGREYRVDAPALWCPSCQTTIAQVELEDVDSETNFNDIVFKIDGKDLIVATTRPELLSACVSLFINPKDERAKDLVGKTAKVPLFDFEVPILADNNAEIDKGTGVVMCCTFGDQMDMEWQKQHDLEIKVAIEKNGTMSKLAGKYSGMKIKEARAEIIEDLKAASLLISQKKITHTVNVCERCKTPIEFVASKQWFVKYLDLKEDMLKWGNLVNWTPAFMKTRYDNWVKGLKWDWCISRQIPFGISFPVWYCKDCDETILADPKDLPVDPLVDKAPVSECPKCKCTEFVGEKDIMNTWATSSLTPAIIKDLVKGTKAYDKIKDKPMSMRRNGQDIITFWDFNTIVKSQLHEKMNPWNDLYINGWMLGKDGRKMSKSLGNGVSPQKVIDEYSADCLRYLSACVKPGDALAFPEHELLIGKKLVNKILNASRFVFMNLDEYNGKDRPEKLEMIDSLFLDKVNILVKEVTENFEKYELSKAKIKLDQFFWSTFCDNYLEIVKKRVYQGSGDAKLSAQYTLYNGLLTMLKLWAPIVPFITEEVYQNHYKKILGGESIHTSEWPKAKESEDKSVVEKYEDGELGWDKWNLLVDLIGKVRQEKSNAQKAMNAEIKLTLTPGQIVDLSDMINDLRDVTGALEVSEGEFSVSFVEKTE